MKAGLRSNVRRNAFKRFLLISGGLVLALLSLVILLAPGQRRPKMAGDLPPYFDERVPVLMDQYSIPGISIALIEDGETTWAKSYGLADVEAGIEMTPATYARAQSITKAVTAWGLMHLVEQGELKLTDRVAEHFLDWKFPGDDPDYSEITVDQLLSHRAGLSLGTIGLHYPPSADVPTLQENLSAEVELLQPPGKSFSYSNNGFNLLELLIQDVTGRQFAEYMEHEVLDPLGMNTASFEWSENWDPGVAVGYDLQGDRVPVYVYPEKGSGGLFVQLEDLAAFVEAELLAQTTNSSVVLSSESISRMHSPVVALAGQYALISDDYGYGHFIEQLPNGQRAVWHGGQGHGWMTHYHAVPETGDGIVIVANSQRSWPFFAHVLGAWADWHGFGRIGMELILEASRFLWVLILLIASAALLIGSRTVWQWRQGARSLQTPFMESSFGSWLLLAAALVVGVTVIWTAVQEYSFMAVVFPVAHVWLGAALLLSALAMVAAALLPRRDTDLKS